MVMMTVGTIQMSPIIVRCVIQLENSLVKMEYVFYLLMYVMVKMIVVTILMKTCTQMSVVSIQIINDNFLYLIKNIKETFFNFIFNFSRIL